MKSINRIACGLGVVAALLAGSAGASVTVGATRVVYPLENREVTVKLNNDRAEPSLVQVWMDKGNADAKPGEASAPFVLTPPIFRMEANKSQTLRMMYTGDALPQDRESVFWLNVLDVPPKTAKNADVNSLQFAFRTRVKVFARPEGLARHARGSRRKSDLETRAGRRQERLRSAGNESDGVLRVVQQDRCGRCGPDLYERYRRNGRATRHRALSDQELESGSRQRPRQIRRYQRFRRRPAVRRRYRALKIR